MAKKFPSEMNSRGTVKITDKLMIHNIDTGATEYTTVQELLAALSLYYSSGGVTSSLHLDTGNPSVPLEIRMCGSGDRRYESSIRSRWEAGNTSFLEIGTYQGDVYTKNAHIELNGAWFKNNVSAESFTDRTPHFEGDALSELKKVSGKNGMIDHDTLPAFARVKQKRNIEKKQKGKTVITEETVTERDLGAMITLLTKAVQQQLDINGELEKRITELEAKAK